MEPCLYAARVMASATASASVRGLGTSPGRLGIVGACTSSPGLCLALSAWRALGPVTASEESCFAVAELLGRLSAAERLGWSDWRSAFPAGASEIAPGRSLRAPRDGVAGASALATGSRGMALGRVVMGASLPAAHCTCQSCFTPDHQVRRHSGKREPDTLAHRERLWAYLTRQQETGAAERSFAASSDA